MKQLLFSLVTATLMSWNAGATAAKLDCPEPVGQLAQDVKADVEGKAQTLFKIGELQLKGEAQKTITNLFEKYPNADRVAIAQNIQSQFCNFLKTSNLPDEKKFQMLFQLNEQVIKLISPPPGGSSEPDQKAVYLASGRRDDLRTVNSYFTKVAQFEDRRGYACHMYVKRYTWEIYVDDKTMRVSNFEEEYGNYACVPPFERNYEFEKDSTCSANISDLDEILHVPERCPPTALGAPELEIRCLSGRCVTCKYNERGQGRAKADSKTEEGVHDDRLIVYLGIPGKRRDLAAPDAPIATCATLNDFSRALSRIISFGSDEAFCKARPSYCQQ